MSIADVIMMSIIRGVYIKGALMALKAMIIGGVFYRCVYNTESLLLGHLTSILQGVYYRFVFYMGCLFKGVSISMCVL